jgi:hypothetical protein
MKKLILKKLKGQRMLFPFLSILMIISVVACGTDDKNTDSPPITTEETNVDEAAYDASIDTDTITAETSTEENETMDVQPVAAGQDPVKCGGNELAGQMKGFADMHSGVPYDLSDPSTQCSGIFQRFLGSIREACPEAVANTPPSSNIDSREQGKWYYDKGALTVIKDPIASAELIRPGVVMFYGKLKQEFYNSNPIEKFWTREEGIRHVGVVVDVERDEATGEIQSYSLFHGRRPGLASGISNADNYMHRREAKANAPSFGNGPDPWIGVAAVVLQN